MNKKPLTIWFNQNNEMADQGYNSTYHPSGFKSENAEDFDDCLELIKLREYNKKNTRVILKSINTGRSYTMFVYDFNNILEKRRVINLHVSGTFRFIKKGSGQAIKLVLPE